MNSIDLPRLQEILDGAVLIGQEGRVTQVVGMVVEAELPGVAVGTWAEIGGTAAEVIGFRGHRALLMPLGPVDGIRQGQRVVVRHGGLHVRVGKGLLGRVLDALGQPMDGGPLRQCPFRRSLDNAPPNPLRRQRIEKPLETGIRAMDGLLTLGEGQRIALMAGSGVGKSTLLGMVARHCRADVNVVALVGERGREVREFLERDLGEEGLARSVVVIATGDKSPILKVKAAFTAMSIAEHFRDEGKQVLLMVDSITRLAMAQREIGLAAGEPPTTRGYTPSVFGLLPRLLERAGPGEKGSITAVCTVLVEGDDMEDPVADIVRSIVDGHVVLSRKLASHGHYPAIDILQSVSRTMASTVDPAQVGWAGRIRDLLATWSENEELIRLGAYRKGTDPDVDLAIQTRPEIEKFLCQGVAEKTAFNRTQQVMKRLANKRARVASKTGSRK